LVGKKNIHRKTNQLLNLGTYELMHLETKVLRKINPLCVLCGFVGKQHCRKAMNAAPPAPFIECRSFTVYAVALAKPIVFYKKNAHLLIFIIILSTFAQY
jgi:hypothetical protein